VLNARTKSLENARIRRIKGDFVVSFVKDAGVLLQPTRYKIIVALKAANRSMYVDEIARAIREKPRLTSFHLAMMEHHGFLSSEWNEVKKPNSPSGKAGRFFSLTPKVDTVFSELKEKLP
jgi:DNA-binding transcriptional ArsR family regulator